MPDHDPTNIAELDCRGERRWSFSLRYVLPDGPADNRDWFNAIAITDETVHPSAESYSSGIITDEAWGSAWVKKNEILFLMKANGLYSSAYESVTKRVEMALTQGSLAVSQLIEVGYIDPDQSNEDSEPPF